MPQFPPGALFGDPRHLVSAGADEGLYWSHRCEVQIPALAAAPPDGRLVAEVRSVNYHGTYDAAGGETFPAFVARRRAELRRERDLLARFHLASAHVPQVLDWVEGTNAWDRRVIDENLAAGEPALLVRRVEAESVAALGPVSVDEAVALAGRLLRVLRVFHAATLDAEPHYFGALGPDDVLVARGRGGVWFRNVWKLRTGDELAAGWTPCEPQLRGFVSPAMWGRLAPRPAALPPVGGDVYPEQLDLYSVGALVVFLLLDSPDLTRPPPGWPGPGAAAEAARRRGLPAPVADFLAGLLTHRFDTADDALEAWAKARQVRTPGAYGPPTPPKRKQLTEVGLADGILVANRYRVAYPISEGGMGCVYLADDTRTGSRVVMKVPRYSRDETGRLRDFDPTNPQAMLARREEMVREAETALRAQARTGAVPQVIDVALVPCPVPEFAAVPALANQPEPVLVMEFIPGVPLRDPSVRYTEEDLLVLLRGLCTVLADLHRPAADGSYHLYADWKPENVLFHTESGTFTVIDLGGLLTIDGRTGEFAGDLTSTPLYAGAEEDLPGGAMNRALRPPYDLHGIAAVCWRLAAVYPANIPGFPDNDFQTLDGAVYNLRVATRSPRSLLPELDFLPPDYQQLRPILERALQPDPAKRYQTAAELAAAATRGLGRLYALPPEAPADATAVPAGRPGGCDVEVACTLPADPFREKLVIFRGDAAPVAARGAPWREVDVTGHPPGRPVLVRDDGVPDSWTAAHYAIFAVGYNGVRSAPADAATPLLTDPESATAEPVEGGLRLSWAVPEGVRRNGGVVVVERLPDRTRLGAFGPGTNSFTDAGLDPTADYRYRLFSELSFGTSPGREVAARPWPVFARVTGIAAEADDRRVRLKWAMAAGAATEVKIVRSQTPLDAAEVARVAAARGGFTPVRFRAGPALHVAGATDNTATVTPTAGGVECEWIDTTAVPGVEYDYTPVFRFTDHPKPHEWQGPTARGAAFAEAPRFDATPLPGAVRLSWDLPDRAVKAAVTRAAAGDAPAETREFAPGQPAWVDRHAPAGGAAYECRVLVGPSWSRGVSRTAAPAPALTPLPPAAPAVPGVKRVEARGGRGELEVRWLPPAGASTVLLTLPGHGRGQVVEASGRGRWTFADLPPGPCRVEARVLGPDHRLSPPAAATEVVT